MQRSRVLFALLLVLASSQSLLAQAPQNSALAGTEISDQLPATNPFSMPADVEEGNALYLRHCAYCHGAQGEGGRGVDLTAGIYKRGGGDADLFRTIRSGVPGTEMPAVRATETETWKIAAFVRKIGSSGLAARAAGDPQVGRRVYERNRCANCHRIARDGSGLGPELTDVGRRRGLEFLSDAVVKPEADVPVAYRPTQVLLKRGASVTGLRLNEDDLSIQLRDMAGDLRSFLKTDVSQIHHDQPTLMPAYTSLSKTDLENLVAYLSSLKGAQ